MTKAQRLEAQHAVVRELIAAARGCNAAGWLLMATDMAEDLEREMHWAKRQERKALAGQVATAQQPASAT